jgi:hypothetical protein
MEQGVSLVPSTVLLKDNPVFAPSSEQRLVIEQEVTRRALVTLLYFF